ncbi:MAG: C40 family peptidase [Desulfovibrio sp.]|jgi:cell wall-associated NlpC family hydrolase|nr:C40 family peptidase [Desulfovibrio sp.]
MSASAARFRRIHSACFPALFLFVLFVQGCSLRQGVPEAGGPASGQAISKTAMSMVGVPYKPGGADPKSGFDCSGLVSWSYAQNGVSLPRTTREQSSMGSAVQRTGLKPGDILVFRIKSGLHTGIYTGSGKFVHSPGRGKTVRVDSVHGAYWQARFVAGRRLKRIY